PVDAVGGLSALLGQSSGLASLGALLGNHQSIETDLAIARSQAVLEGALAHLASARRDRLGRGDEARVRLRKKADIAALRGGLLQISVRDGDPDLAKAIAAAYVAAIHDRLGQLSLEQSAVRRAIAVERVGEAATRLADAQAAITRFRANNRVAAPELQLGAAVGGVAGLQARLAAKQVELETASRFATPNNIRVQALNAEIAGLRGQIEQAQSNSSALGSPTLGQMSLESSEYANLYRNVHIAETFYEVYTRALEQVTVEEMSAGASVSISDPTYVVPERQYNVLPFGLLILVIALALVAEAYDLAPPIGRRPA
ncbi:MAG: hypothetical protein ABI056_08805, partial [Caulobacteraceae bacterium]